MINTTTSASKTVYVLGAGFSRNANVPLQSEILECVREMNLINTPSILQDKFTVCQGKSISFVNRIFKEVSNPSLEDVFTLLDQSVRNNNYCLGYNWLSLGEVRRALYEAIVILFHTREKETPDDKKEFYRFIAAYLIEDRLNAGQENDPFSIISLNWDCVLENAVYSCLEQCDDKKVDIDYCCYTNPFKGASRHIPSINQKALKLYNIKFLKLHGSVNWLLCPNCNRLYTGLGAPSEIMEEYISEKVCPQCIEFTDNSEENKIHGPILEPFIITPTFVKEFGNAHIQMVWHNAYIELREANRVVFIGYSLPEADYHLRTLLKRAIRPNIKIDVVLMPNDKFPADCEEHNRNKYAESRYKAFFGEEPNLLFEGAEGYFKEVVQTKPLNERLISLKKVLSRVHESA